jgi:hypothetical protein
MTQVVVCGGGQGGAGWGDRQLSVLVSWSACAQLSPYAIGREGAFHLINL